MSRGDALKMIFEEVPVPEELREYNDFPALVADGAGRVNLFFRHRTVHSGRPQQHARAPRRLPSIQFRVLRPGLREDRDVRIRAAP